MKFSAPDFWYREGGEMPLLEKILLPFSIIYRIGYEVHQHSVKPQKFGFPVLCIGNINTGGTGKTPVALAVMDLIRVHKLARNPYFLLRGYGGSEEGPLRVDPKQHTSENTGDEALLLAEKAPTIISADRVAGAKLAADYNADLVLMDDGLQNPGLYKDIKIVVINGEMGFGNGHVLPAGPLREPLGKGLSRADLFILIGEDRHDIADHLPEGKPLIRAHLEPVLSPHLQQGKKYVAFAGLGYPDKFFSFLKNVLSLDVVKTIRFPDHYPYTENDLRDLAMRAKNRDAELVTTRKDFMRLPPLDDITIHTADIRIAWDNESDLVAFLKSHLKAA